MDTPVVDLRSYLTQDGECADLPDADFAVASFMFAIVEWVTMAGPTDAGTLTNVTCRRHAGGRACRGPILARADDALAIGWHCAACGDRGVIVHWQGTLWDRRAQAWAPPLPPRC